MPKGLSDQRLAELETVLHNAICDYLEVDPKPILKNVDPETRRARAERLKVTLSKVKEELDRRT